MVNQLREQAKTIFSAAVEAADPAKSMRPFIEAEKAEIIKADKIIVVAAGKAAVPMMKEASSQIDNRKISKAICITNYENAEDIKGVECFASGHPIPDENGLRAAHRVIEVLNEADESTHVIALISGGASALMPAPVDGVSLKDKANVNAVLMHSGFEITELNLVRQQLSQLKGGGFAQLANPAKVTAFILSDVIGDDLRVIASGPTVSPIADRKTALNLVTADNIKGEIPKSVLMHLAEDVEYSAPNNAKNILVGSNRQSLDRAKTHADTLNWNTVIVDDQLIGPVSDAANRIDEEISKVLEGSNTCLLFGGETSVIVTGNGKGGRNQDLALRIAIKRAASNDNWVFLSGGTDGRDGPTDAAGALVDAKSIERMNAKGVDAEEELNNNNSNAALTASDDLLITGATGTNVADIQVVLVK